jgi:alanyl-tRNA synthetase
VVALAVGMTNGKPTVMLAASASATRDHSVHAGNLLKGLLGAFGGRGGGKPSFAQGGYPGEVSPQDLIQKALALLK